MRIEYERKDSIQVLPSLVPLLSVVYCAQSVVDLCEHNVCGTIRCEVVHVLLLLIDLKQCGPTSRKELELDRAIKFSSLTSHTVQPSTTRRLLGLHGSAIWQTSKQSNSRHLATGCLTNSKQNGSTDDRRQTRYRREARDTQCRGQPKSPEAPSNRPVVATG